MVNPFSIATGVAGLLSLGIEVVKILNGFIQDWEEVPKDVENFRKKLDHLITSLRKTDELLMESPAPHVDETSSKEEYIERCIQELYKLRDSLNVNRKTVLSTSWDRIKRAISPEALRRSVADMNRYCEQINRDVTRAIFKVSKSTKEEVAQVHGVLTKRYQEEDHTKILSWISTWNFQERHKYLLQKHP